jgi:hypothetical protein
MAVTITEADLVQPIGRLDPDVFPKGNLDTMLPGWLDVATAKVESNPAIALANQNDATAAWVYYLAYGYLAGQMLAMPQQVSEGDGAISVTMARDAWKAYLALADAWHKSYYLLETSTVIVIEPIIFTVS